MINSYIELVKAYPVYSAMLQFALLGTLGDLIGRWIIDRKITLPPGKLTIPFKMIEWAFLAILIKYAFAGFNGFVDALVSHDLLPEPGHFTRAFAVSTAMNLQFGPFLVMMHRLLDNLITGQPNWQNIDKGFMSLLWFWIPAHTVTFTLDKPLQIGLAALWSIVLGIILGFYNRRPPNA